MDASNVTIVGEIYDELANGTPAPSWETRNSSGGFGRSIVEGAAATACLQYYQNTTFASDLVLQLERMLRSVLYVGPLREYPRRLYLWSGEIPDHVGAKGDRAKWCWAVHSVRYTKLPDWFLASR